MWEFIFDSGSSHSRFRYGLYAEINQSIVALDGGPNERLPHQDGIMAILAPVRTIERTPTAPIRGTELTSIDTQAATTRTSDVPVFRAHDLLRAAAERAALFARHRAETERAIAAVRADRSLTEAERARKITETLAGANGRVLAMASAARERRKAMLAAMR